MRERERERVVAWNFIRRTQRRTFGRTQFRTNWALEDDDTDDTGNPTPPNTQGRADKGRGDKERSNWGGGEGQQGLWHGNFI